MKENTDLVQIRPAFGGDIMAQIITPDHHPKPPPAVLHRAPQGVFATPAL